MIVRTCSARFLRLSMANFHQIKTGIVGTITMAAMRVATFMRMAEAVVVLVLPEELMMQMRTVIVASYA